MRFPTVVAAWRRAWEQVTPFFAFPPAVRRILYTTNALLYLVTRTIKQNWSGKASGWGAAMPHFAILHSDRFTQRD